MAFKLPHIRVDALLGVTDTFRESARGSLEGYTVGNEITRSPRVSVHCQYPLAAYEQSLYFAAIAAATTRPLMISGAASDPAAIAMWNGLQVSDPDLSGPSLATSCSWSALARYAGMQPPGGRTYVLMASALSCLAAASCTVTRPPVTWSSRLLAWAKDPKGVRIALHPHVARVALPGAISEKLLLRYGIVSLEERALLQDPVTQLAHAWLSCYLKRNERRPRSLKIDTVARHLWADALDPRGHAKRLVRLRRALAAIGQLPGWLVCIQEGYVYVQRHARPPVSAELSSAA
jgi:hypothetical protein